MHGLTFDRMLVVGLGAAVGANLRYLLIVLIGSHTFPWATLAANLIGCFGLTFFAFYVTERTPVTEEVRLLVSTGFYGGLTTFSTFNIELINLFRAEKWQIALLYGAVSIGFGLLGGLLGMVLARNI